MQWFCWYGQLEIKLGSRGLILIKICFLGSAGLSQTGAAEGGGQQEVGRVSWQETGCRPHQSDTHAAVLWECECENWFSIRHRKRSPRLNEDIKQVDNRWQNIYILKDELKKQCYQCCLHFNIGQHFNTVASWEFFFCSWSHIFDLRMCFSVISYFQIREDFFIGSYI